MVARLSLGQNLGPGQRVLIVLDQFEQWLHVHDKAIKESGLLAALQSHGEHVKCLILVRDEFCSAIARLFRKLNVDMVNHGPCGENARPVDPFDPTHARHVLELFGMAYDCLPRNPADFTRPRAVPRPAPSMA